MFVWGCFQRGGGYLCALLNGRLLNTPITCFAAHRPFVVATAPIMSPRRGRRCGFRPRCPRHYLWNCYLHEPKYVCADFCIRASVCPAMGACTCAWAFARNGSIGGMRGTNRAEPWEGGVRASLPPPGWIHYLTAGSLQATAQPERSALQSARSLDALIFQRPPLAPPLTRTRARSSLGGTLKGIVAPSRGDG